ncbi:hypothetical protein K466DRAFT_668466 [Polyporus arcularius HHB13444]|uniref:Uncharacterized protein n=1 Tax=Polyporus arcularius HHB13444 TaxID=1314778 RepID=A0A5C3NMB6_9APHY|nr:hypothetical protein K466DRAFT_668466 [Polyporus arcularius HHB13444]
MSSPPAMSPQSSSSSSSSARHPSPLSHAMRPPSVPLPSQSTQAVRSRGSSVSTIRAPALLTSPVITRVVSTPVSHSLSSSTTTLGPAPADFRSRSVSRSRRASSTSRHHSPIRDLAAVQAQRARGCMRDIHPSTSRLGPGGFNPGIRVTAKTTQLEADDEEAW